MTSDEPINQQWPTVTLQEHLEALREADMLFREERDRRYAEVNVEKEKALKIKETADLAALQLAREIQTYKDEKANELREQINSERGLYPTKDDLANVVARFEAAIKPLSEFVTAEQGKTVGVGQSWGVLVAVITVMIGLATVLILVFR